MRSLVQNVSRLLRWNRSDTGSVRSVSLSERGSYRAGAPRAKKLRLEALEVRTLLSCSGAMVYGAGLLMDSQNLPDTSTAVVAESLSPSSVASETLALSVPDSLTDEDVFSLASCPDSKFTIYLDFTGHTTTGTYWNSFYGSQVVTPVFSIDDSESFNAAERSVIWTVWTRVAEDFAPFNVNVTTVEPSAANLIRAGSNDSAWGIRICIGGSYNDWYGSAAGGISFAGSFNWDSDTPVFAFTQDLYNNSRYIAECVSHETGHSLGLGHDGQDSNVYYAGTSLWAPIMGNSYYASITQWSCGEYTGATNTQDDLAIITTNNGFGYRNDDHGDSLETATALAALIPGKLASGIIETRTDVDFFSFTANSNEAILVVGGTVNVTNLNVSLSLYDATGSLLQTWTESNSFWATLDLTSLSGDYYLSVTGCGMGDPTSNGFSDYASLGAYTVTVVYEQPGETFELVLTTDSTACELENFCGARLEVATSLDSAKTWTWLWDLSGTGTGPLTARLDMTGTFWLSSQLFSGQTEFTVRVAALAGDGTLSTTASITMTLTDSPTSWFVRPIVFEWDRICKFALTSNLDSLVGQIIDWGDGTTTDLTTRASWATLTHVYQTEGEFLVTVGDESGSGTPLLTHSAGSANTPSAGSVSAGSALTSSVPTFSASAAIPSEQSSLADRRLWLTALLELQKQGDQD